MYIRVGLLLSRTKCGNISVARIELVNPAGRISAPGRKSLLLDTLAARFVGTKSINPDTFGHGISHGGHAMIGIHAARVAVDLRECRHPACTHLVGHAEERSQDSLLAVTVEKYSQRMSRTVGIPYPVVGIKWCTFVVMHLPVESAEIAPVLAHAYGTLECTVVRRIKHRLLILATAFHLYTPERVVPHFAPLGGHILEIEVLYLTGQIECGLLLGYERHAVAQHHIFRTVGKLPHRACIIAFLAAKTRIHRAVLKNTGGCRRFVNIHVYVYTCIVG
ncbi:hypothetical protein IMSAG192_01639 [Muribaculaceae bacterium]|nr:hypothetical protein IMSAG192_01639 [Muribaculaceae bacterium]